MQMRCLLRERKGFRKGFRVEGAGLVGTVGEWLCHIPQYSSVLGVLQRTSVLPVLFSASCAA